MTIESVARRTCACGGAKDAFAKLCRTCWSASRTVDLAGRKATNARWRAAHPDYYRDYMRRRRLKIALGGYYDHCPRCAKAKPTTRELCRYCVRTARLVKPSRGDSRIRAADELVCWSCDVELRKSSWRGQEFLKCPSCGLEIKKAPMYVTVKEAA